MTRRDDTGHMNDFTGGPCFYASDLQPGWRDDPPETTGGFPCYALVDDPRQEATKPTELSLRRPRVQRWAHKDGVYVLEVGCDEWSGEASFNLYRDWAVLRLAVATRTLVIARVTQHEDGDPVLTAIVALDLDPDACDEVGIQLTSMGAPGVDRALEALAA